MDYKDYNDFELVYRVSDSEDALEIILDKYEPIINSMAFSYIREYFLLGLDVDDLIQEGRIAVVIAINKFVDSKNVLFYTYVIMCIKSAMLHYIRKCCSGKNSLIDFSLCLDDLEFDISSEGGAYVAVDPIDFLQDEELYNDILKFKCDLNHDDAAIFTLKTASFSYNEISLLLGVSKIKISKRLEFIRKKLKRYLLNLSYDL